MTGREPALDVAVIGGGTAGVAAALAACAAGARTLLVERSDRLGGNAALAFVHTICGLYLPACAGDAVPAHAGFPRRFAEGLTRAGGAQAPERAGRVWVLPIEPPQLADYARELCERAAPELDRRFGCELTAAELARDATAPSRLVLRTQTGERAEVEARSVVDTSGDAAVAALGAADFEQAPPTQLQVPSYIVRLAGVDTRELEGFGRLRLTHAVAAAAREGALPAGCESVLVRRSAAPDEAYLTLNVPRPSDRFFDPLDPTQLAELERSARSAALALVALLRDTRAAFRDARVAAWPARIGVRETRRISGLAVVTEQDVLAGRRRPDEVAVSTWPVELWDDARRARFRYPEGPCSVPLGALASRSHPRLAAAGRCVSATHEALGALRVIGTALATGEAAGVAAALAADRGVAIGAIAAADVVAQILMHAERGERR